MNPFAIPAVPQTRRIDPQTGHPVTPEMKKVTSEAPPCEPTPSQWKSVLREQELLRERQAARENPDITEAANWIRGRSANRALIELAAKVARIERALGIKDD